MGCLNQPLVAGPQPDGPNIGGLPSLQRRKELLSDPDVGNILGLHPLQDHQELLSNLDVGNIPSLQPLRGRQELLGKEESNEFTIDLKRK